MPLRLNMGAGDRRLEGWVGVDAVARLGTDILADVRSVPLLDGEVDEIMAIHLVEHLYKWEVRSALVEWARLLRPGGSLVLELPDIRKACWNVVNRVKPVGDKKPEEQLGMWGIYGDPREEDPFMNHKWGWTFETLSPLVQECGFLGVVERQTQWHRIGRDIRDFRLEAHK